jgi:hypothetical protein
LYFRGEHATKGKHAIRRSKVTALLWAVLHFPLCSSICAMGAQISIVLTIDNQTKVNGGQYLNGKYLNFEFQAIYATLVMIIHWSLAGMQLCHKENIEQRTNLSAKVRIFIRVLGGLAFFIIFLAVKLTPSGLIYLTAVIITVEVILEEYGGYKIRKKVRRKMKKAILNDTVPVV